MVHVTRSFTLVSVLVACTASGAPSPSTPSRDRNSNMQEFALIFRPTRPVAPDELPRRNTAARDWALALRQGGTLRNASPLEDDGFTVTQQGVTPASRDRAVAAVLVVEAKDLEAAIALAKGHPGLPFGTEIEVRPVKPGVPPPR
jgi:hypothetical protein